MKVLLKRDWFGPGNVMFRKVDVKLGGTDIPEDLRDKLPKDAVVIGAAKLPPSPVVALEAGRAKSAAEAVREAALAMDEARAAGDLAEAARLKAEKFAEDLKAEQAAEVAKGAGTPAKPKK